jgi:hypothetical protein
MADIIHSKGEAGGYLVGNRHTEGGIKAINKSTGQPLEMEGGEVVITRNAVSDTTKRSFNGNMMTNREILSSINKSGGGVEFAEGGELPATIDFVEAVIQYEGETVDASRVLEKMAVGGQVSDILDDLKDIYDQGGVAPQLEPLRQLKFRIYLKYVDSQGLNKDVILKQGFLGLPQSLQSNRDFFGTGNFDIYGEAILFSDGNQENIVATLQYNTSNIDFLTYSGLRESMATELKKNPLFTKVFQDLYYQATKIYCVGIAPQIYKNDFTLPVVTGGTLLSVYPINTPLNTLGSYSVEAMPFSNFQSFEKLSKKFIAEKVTNFIVDATLQVASASARGTDDFSATISVTTDDFVNGKGLPKKWNWWKENIFAKQGLFSPKRDRIIFSNFLDDIDFAPFECEQIVSVGAKRSQAQRVARQKLIEKGSEASEIFVSTDEYGYKSEIILPPLQLDVKNRGRFDVSAVISYDVIRLGRITKDLRFDAYEKIFSGKKVFFFWLQ